MTPHRHIQPASEFWRWFVLSEARFRDLAVPERESLLDEFLDHLHAFCPDLYFAIGGAPEGPNELIVTADGAVAAFACVRSIVDAAPTVAGWEFIAFKPALGFDCVIEKGVAILDPRLCWFLPVSAPLQSGALVLRIACPGYSDAAAEDFAFAAWEALDSGLGEQLTAEYIDDLEVVAVPSNPLTHGYIPLPELQRFLLSTLPRPAPN